MLEYGIGLHNDVSGGMTADHDGKTTKVFMISLPHHHRIMAPDGVTARRVKGTSPLPVSIVVTTTATGSKLALQWILLREQLEAIKPGVCPMCAYVLNPVCAMYSTLYMLADSQMLDTQFHQTVLMVTVVGLGGILLHIPGWQSHVF
jgi:hypothetical protein